MLYEVITELMGAVDSYIPTPARPVDQPFLMPVEDVFTITGRGTVVTGRVERGVVKVGETIEIIGIRDTQTTTCTGVEMFRKLLDQGQAGDNIGALLRGIKKDDVERGQVLAKPGSITPHTDFTRITSYNVCYTKLLRWWIRVLENKYPALSSNEQLGKKAVGIYDKMNAVGRHEVIVETEEHKYCTSQLTYEEIEKIIWAYRDRYLEISEDKNIKHILIFKNYGVEAGASIEHTHSP